MSVVSKRSGSIRPMSALADVACLWECLLSVEGKVRSAPTTPAPTHREQGGFGKQGISIC